MKKSLRINHIYSFEELPVAAKKDLLLQYENDDNFFFNNHKFLLCEIPYSKLLEEFDEFLGPNLIDELEDDYIKELAEDIEKNGLKNIPIGTEGIHRSLAHLYLKKDMLRFIIL